MSNESSDPREFPEVAVVVIDDQQVRSAANVDDWNATTLLACVSEDPAEWSEVAAVWPRYRTGLSAEFADALPLRAGDLESALSLLRAGGPWLVIDLKNKRIFSSADYDEVHRDGCFGMGPDTGSDPAIRVWIHLPPWWEICNDADPGDVAGQRHSEIRRPDPRREVLWGAALAEGLADQMLEIYGSDRWRNSDASENPRERYSFTVEVHRGWLMTPRDDLGGRIPRESLHGGIGWIDRLIEGQQWNMTNDRDPIPFPRELVGYDNAPMGRNEVCLYFDLCRELIDDGWQWLVDQDEKLTGMDRRERAMRLAERLKRVQHDWLRAPFEGGSPPLASIQAERDRIPQTAGAAEDGHPTDCDCPICDMMAEGAFGPCFVGFDGHHLELDEEFAFSLCETREEWEMQQQEYADMSAAIEERLDEEEDEESSDEFPSVWPQNFALDELPGDTTGHIGIAFGLADIIGELQIQEGTKANVDALNAAFRALRHASDEQRSAATERFKDALEEIAQRHDSLVGRAADLQSRLDDLLRRPALSDSDNDVPN